MNKIDVLNERERVAFEKGYDYGRKHITLNDVLHHLTTMEDPNVEEAELKSKLRRNKDDESNDEDTSLELLTWGDDFDIDVVVDAEDDVNASDIFKIVRFVKEDCGDSFDDLLIEDVSDLYDLLNDGVPEVSESEKELKRLIGDEVFNQIKNIYVKLCYFDIPCKGYGRHDVDFSFTYLKNESKARQIAHEKIMFDF